MTESQTTAILSHRSKNPILRLMGIAIVALMLAAVPASASDLWFHVTVNEPGEENANVTLNFPFSWVEAMLPMIPEEVLQDGRIVLDDTELDITKLRNLWNEVQDTPDMTFVTVQSDNESIRVFKEGNYLVARTSEATADGTKVNARLPLSVVDALLSDGGNTLNVRAALNALVEHGEGELVTVTEGDSNVRIWIDSTPEAN